MRVLIPAAVLVVVVAVAVVGVYTTQEHTRRSRARKWGRARWVDNVTATESHTWVTVQRVYTGKYGARTVLADQLIASVRADNPNHDEIVKDARMRAYNRAIDLNNQPLAG